MKKNHILFLGVHTYISDSCLFKLFIIYLEDSKLQSTLQKQFVRQKKKVIWKLKHQFER